MKDCSKGVVLRSGSGIPVVVSGFKEQFSWLGRVTLPSSLRMVVRVDLLDADVT